MNDTTPSNTALPAQLPSGWPRRQVLKAGALALGVTMAGRFAFAADNGSALTASEYDALDAWAMAEAVRAGELSGAQLLAAALARYRAVNPLVNAVNMLHEDYARALLNGRSASKGALADERRSGRGALSIAQHGTRYLFQIVIAQGAAEG
ncbi:hypothetical protein OMR07_30370, partial [Methylobacterium organophilum]|nr:hypothetical protein [Methylobacterium organophilum]